MIELAFPKMVNTVLTADFTSPLRKPKPQSMKKLSKRITEKKGTFSRTVIFFNTCSYDSTGQLQ